MMINKRLIQMVGESRKYITGNVCAQWLSLAANMTLMTSIADILGKLAAEALDSVSVRNTFFIAGASLAVRFFCSIQAAKMSYLAGKAVKTKLRTKIYEKLLKLGPSYHEQIQTSEVVQVAVEGVEQLETYFGAYLPQFFYAVLAPLTLFLYLCRINLATSAVLFICVPLIPVTIAVIQTWAKKLLGQYWGEYTTLGDTFLENLQGLTTLKIYQADDWKQQEMNEQAERFRRITMKVLSMQLNSITIMDLIAYGGAAAGAVLSVTHLQAGQITFSECLLFILLSADFFIPMRQLGSFFHIAMNGMAASDKIFRLLELPEPKISGQLPCPADHTIRCEKLSFSYSKDVEILHNVSMCFPPGTLTAIVGASGSGKSTIAGILSGKNTGFRGHVTIGGTELSSIQENAILKAVTYIGHQSYLFKGTVRENLLMGKPNASDPELWVALHQVKLAEFLQNEQGLDTLLNEQASNLSGGQRQRLALARAILHNSPIYIFDEAASNVDVESENDIMHVIRHLAKTKTVILISHRLANVVPADRIYVLKKGKAAEAGTHAELLKKNGIYAGLWNAQQELEYYTGGTSA